MSTTASYQANVHRLSPDNIWLPDNRASHMIVNGLAKQQAEIPKSSILNMSEHSSTASSTNSSIASIDTSTVNNNNKTASSHISLDRQTNDKNASATTSLSRRSSTNSRRHRADTASLKEYGECYKRLGEGTTATVMVVRQLDTNGRSKKLYAIKQFRKKQKHESDKEYMKKLTSEFCISSTFTHPNIVKTIDLVLDDKKRYCTVMEYCPGGDLFTSIMNERMTEVEKLCCFKQMVQGLAYLHSVGVAHRDIKPENLLLTMDGKLKITDFGVSDVFRFPWESKGRKSKGLVGSEPYISPEAFEEKGKNEYHGSCADMWSAGIVFYCILQGGLAWHKANKSDSSYCGYLRVYENNPESTSSENKKIFDLFKCLTPDQERVLSRLLDPNPRTRITAEKLLNDPWFQSIPVCENSVDANGNIHRHTNGVQPVCTVNSRK